MCLFGLQFPDSHIWKALVCLAGSWDEVTVPEEQSCFCILMTMWSGKIKEPIRMLGSQELSENEGSFLGPGFTSKYVWH